MHGPIPRCIPFPRASRLSIVRPAARPASRRRGRFASPGGAKGLCRTRPGPRQGRGRIPRNLWRDEARHGVEPQVDPGEDSSGAHHVPQVDHELLGIDPGGRVAAAQFPRSDQWLVTRRPWSMPAAKRAEAPAQAAPITAPRALARPSASRTCGNAGGIDAGTHAARNQDEFGAGLIGFSKKCPFFRKSFRPG